LLSARGPAKAGDQTNANGPATVDITLKEFTVESSVTKFKPGVKYHFVVKNEGQAAHEFMVMPVKTNDMGIPGMTNMTMKEKDANALMMIPQEQLPVSAIVEKDYIFTNVPQGNIEMVCTLPGHFEAGMRLPITIK